MKQDTESFSTKEQDPLGLGELERQLEGCADRLTQEAEEKFQNVSDLGQTIEEIVTSSLRYAAKGVKFGLNRAAETLDAVRFGGASSEPRQAGELSDLAQKKREKSLRQLSFRHRLQGIALTVTGGIGMLGFGLPILDGFHVISDMVIFLALFTVSLVMLAIGVEKLGFSSFVRDLNQILDRRAALPLDYLAEGMHMSAQKLRRKLRGYLKSKRLTGWLDRNEQHLYLDLDSWRASLDEQPMEEAAPETQPKPEPEAEPQPAAEPQEEETPDSLTQLRRFVAVLEKERPMMADDPQAAEELEQLENTSRMILQWTEKHPDSLPRVRRLAEQYVPMTLKLLYTYNDLKLHNGENAAHVRRDIAGMLHSLNLGFAALQDQLLDDVAMDVTGDIAALQGMLAWDGLSDEAMLHTQTRDE